MRIAALCLHRVLFTADQVSQIRQRLPGTRTEVDRWAHAQARATYGAYGGHYSRAYGNFHSYDGMP